MHAINLYPYSILLHHPPAAEQLRAMSSHIFGGITPNQAPKSASDTSSVSRFPVHINHQSPLLTEIGPPAGRLDATMYSYASVSENGFIDPTREGKWHQGWPYYGRGSFCCCLGPCFTRGRSAREVVWRCFMVTVRRAHWSMFDEPS